MNFKLISIARDAGYGDRWHSTEELEMFLERYGKLIVQECVRYFNEDYQRDFDTLWREDLSNGMKEHFGVE